MLILKRGRAVGSVMGEAQKITDHDQIRKWAETRGGRLSVVETTQGHGGAGLLRFDFGEKDKALKEMSWEEFFKIFEDGMLALLEQEETRSAEQSRFSKFVSC